MTAREELKQAKQRIEELQRKLGGSGFVRFDEPFSLRAEERRQKERGKKPRDSKPTERRGRITTAEKVALAARTE